MHPDSRGKGTQVNLGQGCSCYFSGSKIWLELTFWVIHLSSYCFVFLKFCISFFGTQAWGRKETYFTNKTSNQVTSWKLKYSIILIDNEETKEIGCFSKHLRYRLHELCVGWVRKNYFLGQFSEQKIILLGRCFVPQSEHPYPKWTWVPPWDSNCILLKRR